MCLSADWAVTLVLFVFHHCTTKVHLLCEILFVLVCLSTDVTGALVLPFLWISFLLFCLVIRELSQWLRIAVLVCLSTDVTGALVPLFVLFACCSHFFKLLFD